MNRCVNDIFGYCTGEPEGKIKEVTSTFQELGGKISTVRIPVQTCKHKPATCTKFLPQEELVAAQQNIDHSRSP